MRYDPNRLLRVACCLLLFATGVSSLRAQPAAATTLETNTYRKLKTYLDAIPAIDTHDHLWPFDKLPGYVETAEGKGMNLAGLWRNSYLTRIQQITPWQLGMKFDDWWAKAKHDFDDVRAASFYRYQAIAIRDLYGIDFDTITDAQARDLNQRIFRNYVDKRWLFEVVTEKANIELMFNDPYWARFDFKNDYSFGVFVLNVTTLVQGFHPSEFKNVFDDPYHFAKQKNIKLETLDDFLHLLDVLFQEAKRRGAVVLKTTLAYRRSLRFEPVPKERAAKVFGRRREDLNEADITAFEDFIMRHLATLSAKHELPFQIHTGDARIQGSNPMLLVDYIEANPKTKFILFHGGYPWVGETGAIAMKYPNHVWVDSCWLPTISYHMAKRAYHEWLDVMPSTKILWGADCNHAEGIYGATVMTRQCLAEVLAERVDRGELQLEHAQRIGRQILRDNALTLFPQLKDRLWKSKTKPVVEIERTLPLPGEVFRVESHTAFVISASKKNGGPTPWVWYAPTLPNLPGMEERWMFEQFTKAGIAIAGIDVGESFGSPDGRKLFSALHRELTTKRGFADKPVLLGRSRGGLMALAWAVEHPDQTAAFAGIYPVCNIVSYPGVKNASGAYRLTTEQLQAQLAQHNPIDRLAGLAKARVPLFAIHGDVDKVVPLDANSGEMKKRYEALGGKMQLLVPAGQGHNMWPGFFRCQELVDFVIGQARP